MYIKLNTVNELTDESMDDMCALMFVRFVTSWGQFTVFMSTGERQQQPTTSEFCGWLNYLMTYSFSFGECSEYSAASGNVVFQAKYSGPKCSATDSQFHMNMLNRTSLPPTISWIVYIHHWQSNQNGKKSKPRYVDAKQQYGQKATRSFAWLVILRLILRIAKPYYVSVEQQQHRRRLRK